MGSDVVQAAVSEHCHSKLSLREKKIKVSRAEVNNPSVMVAGGDNEAIPILG